MNEGNMKPISIVRQELIDTLASAINDSRLPAFIIEPILKDMYLETKSVAQKQYEYEKAQYEHSLKSHIKDENECDK